MLTIYFFVVCKGMDNGAVGEELLYQCYSRSYQRELISSHVKRLDYDVSIFGYAGGEYRDFYFTNFYLLYPGTQYLQQSYKVSDAFPFKWINKKWREGFYVTAMATSGSRWGVVMSRGAGFSDQVISWIPDIPANFLSSRSVNHWQVTDSVCLFQVVELDFLYPSEGIHRRWDSGYRITATAATWDQAAFVLSVPRRKPADETQETLRTSAFPSAHVKV